MLYASDLIPTIKRLVSSYLEELGDEENVQNAAIFEMITMSLRKLASLAYQQKTSDALHISSDDYAIFQIGNSDITDIYAPQRIINPNERDTPKRVSFTDTKGWWKESTNTNIHINGFTLTDHPMPPGNYILQYVAYPAPVASLGSVVQFPDAGAMGLCYYVAGMICESLPNAKDLASHYYTLAQSNLKIVQQANIDGRGTASGGYVPSQYAIDAVFGG